LRIEFVNERLTTVQLSELEAMDLLLALAEQLRCRKLGIGYRSEGFSLSDPGYGTPIRAIVFVDFNGTPFNTVESDTVVSGTVPR